jgi:hypothetical protein
MNPKDGQQLVDFFDTIGEYERASANHIVIYLALYNCWKRKGYPTILVIDSDEVMHFRRIKKRDTYLLRLKELRDFGYMRYQPGEAITSIFSKSKQ